MSPTLGLRCVACQAPLHREDRFCEACGAERADDASATEMRAVPPATTEAAGTPTTEESPVGCRACGAPASAIAPDRYCTVCGVRVRAPEDRHELDLGCAAAVTDRGLRRRENEDAFHLELAGDGVVAVVCDGVSTSIAGALAARSAAAAAGAVLRDALLEGLRATDATARAIDTAQDAVAALAIPVGLGADSPSCTLVSALWCDDEVVVGCVGDSRAYWIGADDQRQLTTDDSWAAEQIADGLLSEEQAAADRRAHAITRWVGADGPEHPRQVVTHALTAPGRLVLCSDGLWNYARSPVELSKLLDSSPVGQPIAAARTLADIALARGGHDNVTVAVLEPPPRRFES